MGSPHIIKHKAREAGLSEVDYLRQLLTKHTKYTSMAAEIGVSYVGIIKALQRNGLTKQDCRVFEYGGHLATIIGHCRRLGLNDHTIQQNKSRNKFTSKQALDHALKCKAKRQASDSCHVK